MVKQSHPLLAWRVANFKSIGTCDLTLAPLTVLVGPNSAGKSSLLQSLLLAAQASTSTTESGTYPLNGPLLALGNYQDALSDFTPRGQIEIGGELALVVPGDDDMHPRPVSSAWSAVLGPDPASQGAVINKAELTTGSSATQVERVKPATNHTDHLIGRGYSTEYRAETSADGQGRVYDAVLFEGGLPLGGLVRQDRVEWVLTLAGTVLDQALRAPRRRREHPKMGRLDPTAPEVLLQTEPNGAAAALAEALKQVLRTLGAGVGDGGVFYGAARRVLEPLADQQRELLMLRDRQERLESMLAEIQLSIRDVEGGGRRQGRTRDVQRALALLANDGQERFEQYLSEQAELTKPVAAVSWDEVREAARHRLQAYAEEGFFPRTEDLTRGFYPGPAPTLAEGLATRGWLAFLRQRVHYLGPLRDDPRIGYTHSTPGPSHIPLGLKGGLTAGVLYASRAERPRPRPLPGPGRGADTRPVRLQDAVNRWARWFDLGGDLRVEDAGRTLAMTVGGRDLTSVGTGVSQLIPVITICLWAEPGSLVLIEQPEIHLNPALQQKLADFLLAIAATGRQLLIETHSEYLVTRLRRNVATGESDRRLFSLVFAEASPDAGTAFRPVEVNEFGAIQDWPAGFFDQAMTDTHDMAKAALRRMEAAAAERSQSQVPGAQ